MRISDIIEAKREKVRAEAIAEAIALKAERRRKYLEALSEEEREDVLERELERERDRTILERVEEDSFPWERVLD